MKIKISSYSLIIAVLAILYAGCESKDKAPGPVTDIKGNSYKTVRIGDQVWMAENLRTTSYNDGTEIPIVTDTILWNELTSPGICWYNNDESSYKDIYGALYNGYAVSIGNVCPAGWHMPDREEWQQLRSFLGDTLTGGGKLKEEGTTHWMMPNSGADNSSGFTTLPAGIRFIDGSFSSVSYFTSFWSTSEGGTEELWYISLYYRDAIAAMNKISKKYGLSVRCIKD